METASFTGVIKILFYIILFYYIFKFAMRLLLPIVMKKAMEKAQENLRQQEYRFRESQQQYNPPKQERKENKKIVGEYIDYEEIE